MKKALILTLLVVLSVPLFIGMRSLPNSGSAEPQGSLAAETRDNVQTSGYGGTVDDSQAEGLRAKAAQALEHMRSLPFRPVHGDEWFDPEKALTDQERQRWRRHCRLRDVYASERVREPAFQELYSLVDDYGLANDISNLAYLNDIAYSLAGATDHATNYSPELVSESGRIELDDLLRQVIEMNRDVVANIYQMEVNDEFMAALMRIRPRGAIGDPNINVEAGEQIILN